VTWRHTHSIAATLGVVLSCAGCAGAVSTTKFSGEKRVIAQLISNFQGHASTGDEKAVCGQYLARALQTSLAKGRGCKKAVEEQLHEIDDFNLGIEAISIDGVKASAKVKSTFAGKQQLSTLLLVKEAGAWKIAGLAP
jgi:hypothetical protein